MDIIYANSFEITTNGENEIFLIFHTNMPQYDDQGKFIKMEAKKTSAIVLSKDGYSSFRTMIEHAEQKVGEAKDRGS
jgi:hypothetical protein